MTSDNCKLYHNIVFTSWTVLMAGSNVSAASGCRIKISHFSILSAAKCAS